jgi:hypothetical protein
MGEGELMYMYKLNIFKELMCNILSLKREEKCTSGQMGTREPAALNQSIIISGVIENTERSIMSGPVM